AVSEFEPTIPHVIYANVGSVVFESISRNEYRIRTGPRRPSCTIQSDHRKSRLRASGNRLVLEHLSAESLHGTIQCFAAAATSSGYGDRGQLHRQRGTKITGVVSVQSGCLRRRRHAG